jgi:hypothetical protein
LRRNAIKAIGEDAAGVRLLLRADVAAFDDQEALNLREVYNKVALLPKSEALIDKLEAMKGQKVVGTAIAYSFQNMLEKHGLVDGDSSEDDETY